MIRQPSGIRRTRLDLVKLVFLFGIILLEVRLFHLQVVNHDWYISLASGQHDILADLVPKRGAIYLQDHLSPKGTVAVAINKDTYLLYAVPKDIKDPVSTAKILAPLIEREEAELVNIFNKPDDPYEPLKHYLNEPLANQIKALQLTGIELTSEQKRYYPTIANYLGQILGFVGFVNDKREGQYGIEGYWNDNLTGKEGSLRAEKDVAGSLIALGKREIIPAQDGDSLVLTIDYNIQVKACIVLAEAVKKHKADSGSLLVIDPSTGALLAMCNTPNFDPNYYQKVEDAKLFNNPAISDTYEPGSVFKPITMAAALAAGKVTPETVYEDLGSVTIGPDTIKNSDAKAYGRQTMTQVLEKSLNTGAIFVMRQAGGNNFSEMVAKFGFGKKSGIELPAEAPGNIKSLQEGKEIYLATASFGQGISVTPLQLVTAYAAIANRGILMKPYIVSEIINTKGESTKTKPVIVRQVLEPSVARTLAGMMVTVVETGHGKRAAVPGYYIAGKTGTAQVPLAGKLGYDPDKTIGSFVGFAPVDNPRFVMLIKIDYPKDVKFAESTAAPVFSEVAKFLLDYYQVPPDREVE